MSTAGSSRFPQAVVDWLVPPRSGETLAVGASGRVVRRLLARDRTLCVVDKDTSALARQRTRAPGVRVVAATANALPFATCAFATVVVSDLTPDIAPGLATAEFARVLAPGGHLASHRTARDDSVPWVRRLAGILREIDPTAMSASLHDVVPLARDDPSFPEVEKREFRMWVPMTKEAMLAQVAENDMVAHLDPAAIASLIDEVGHLYDASARAPEPLLLPYTVTCWRAEVHHTSPHATPPADDDGFRIVF